MATRDGDGKRPARQRSTPAPRHRTYGRVGVLTIAAAFGLVFVAATVPAADRRLTGYVVEFHGKWRDVTGPLRELEYASPIFVDSRIERRTSSSEDFIELRVGHVLRRFPCSHAPACAAPLPLQGMAQGAIVLPSRLEQIARLLAEPSARQRIVVAGSRSTSPSLRDAVVGVSGGQLSLAGVVSRSDPDDRFAVCRLDHQDSLRCPDTVPEAQCADGSGVCAVARPIVGLYELQHYRRGHRQGSSPAWLLVVDDDRALRNATTQLQEVRDLVATHTAQSSSPAARDLEARTLIRGYLVILARELAP